MTKRSLGGTIGLLLVGAIVAWNFIPDLPNQVGRLMGGAGIGGPMDPVAAEADLDRKLNDVTWSVQAVTGVSTMAAPVSDLAATLPPVETFPMAVQPELSSRATAEIFVSTEKAGTGDDGWMREAAEAFNRARVTLPSGEIAQVAIRAIASGTGYQFIASGKYVPTGYSPSNVLWVEMAEAAGREVDIVAPRTVANVAGIVMKDEAAQTLREAGQLNVPGIIDAVVQGRLVVGYADPFASSTGLNFLVSVLSHFSGGEEGRLLSPEAVSAFESFQARVPFVALTTLQMRESVRRDGSLDAFVMEWQTFAKTEELTRGYEFIPFGWPHDNPLAAIDAPEGPQREALEAFAEFLATPEQQAIATRYGFNPALTHQPPAALPDGDRLSRAQTTWKTSKDAGRPIAAVFVADVSGSMEGNRIAGVQQALREGASFISPESAIGLVTFNHEVQVRLPVRPFAALQNAAFQTAVDQMFPGGGTAMYDAIAVGLRQILDYRAENPDVRPMLFVLTDGETQDGMIYSELSRVIEGIGIPVHTIGFEANIDELSRLSGTVEAASIQANSQNVRYQIGRMFNSQM